MKCNKNARWVIKNIIVDPHFGARFHALSCNLFCQVSQPQEATWRLLIGCYGIRYFFLKSYQEATPGEGKRFSVMGRWQSSCKRRSVFGCRGRLGRESGGWQELSEQAVRDFLRKGRVRRSGTEREREERESESFPEGTES